MTDELKKQVRSCVEDMLKQQEVAKYEIQIDFAIDRGVNYLSDIGNVIVQCTKLNGEKANLYLIAKVSKKSEYRMILSIGELFHREIYVYECIFPMILRIQREHRVKCDFQQFPKLFASSSVDHMELLILENITKKGFILCERTQTLNYKQASMLMKTIGKLHALSFALRNQYPEFFEDMLSKLFDLEYHGAMGRTTKYLIENSFHKCFALLNLENHRQAYNKLKHLPHVLYGILIKMVESEITNPYSVMIHGDLWMTNLMYKYNSAECPTELCILDWQMTKISSPAIDISQIMFVCLDKKIRNLHYDNLINDYYNSFSMSLIELGGNPHISLPFETLQSHLRKFSIIGLYTAMRMITLISVPSDNTPDQSKDFIHNICKTTLDPNLFNDRMRDVLLDYVKYGYDLYTEN